MNLKFDEIKWTDDGLMYVNFKRGKQELKWFPKWAEVACLLDCSYKTEETEHGGDLRTLFEIMCCETIVNALISKVGANQVELGERVIDLFRSMRKTFLGQDLY